MSDRLVIAVLFELPPDWKAENAFDDFAQRLRGTGMTDEALFCSPPLVATQDEVDDPSYGIEVTSFGLYAKRVLEPAKEWPQ